MGHHKLIRLLKNRLRLVLLLLFISVFGHAQKHEWGLRTSIGQSRLTDSINGFGEENSFYFGAGISYNFSLKQSKLLISISKQ